MVLDAKGNRFAVQRVEAVADTGTGLEMRLAELDDRIAAAWAASSKGGPWPSSSWPTFTPPKPPTRSTISPGPVFGRC